MKKNRDQKESEGKKKTQCTRVKIYEDTGKGNEKKRKI